MAVNPVNSFESRFQLYHAKMMKNGNSDISIQNFKHYFRALLSGTTGFISEEEICPAADVPHYDGTSECRQTGMDSISRTVIIKLNGGLGTSMGMDRAKSLLPVKQNLSFLDIIIRQVQALNTAHRIHIPVVFMNSRNTQADTMTALSVYGDLNPEIPWDFVQQRVPKVRQADCLPVEYPLNPEFEWAPPGHGDIYAAMVYSNLLPRLLECGYRYAFVSNADNLGATFDPAILGYIVERRLPFLMEVARRTEADKKGGHLARLKDGHLTLREVAQCPPEDRSFFEDIHKHRYFNTNTIWLDLQVLQRVLHERNHFLGLPLIRNAKSVNPTDRQSEPVFQLESAMGAAISLFSGAGALEVPRDRFFPVKKCQDLLGLWSDAYEIRPDFTLAVTRGRTAAVLVDLDPEYYQMIDDLRKRFPHGAPSLRQCRRVVVRGDVIFGKDITILGDVTIRNDSGVPQRILDGTVLQDESVTFSS